MASLWPEDFNAVCVCLCVAAHCALHCFVCPPICCYVGARAAACSAGFFLETSVISAPICAGTLSDENKASLLRFCNPPTHSPPPPPPPPPRVSASPQDEIAPRRMPTILSDSQSADCSCGSLHIIAGKMLRRVLYSKCLVLIFVDDCGQI